MFAELRAAKVAQVSESLADRSGPATNQSAIWSGISAKAARMGSDSLSGAMSGIYRSRSKDLDDYSRDVKTVPKQIGAAFAIYGRVVGVELFDTPSTCEKYLPKIASGYALDALDSAEASATNVAVASPTDVGSFISRIRAAQEKRYSSVSLGEDIRISGDSLAGAALVFGGKLVHLCAFELEKGVKPAHAQRHVIRHRAPFVGPDQSGSGH
jgi:hypothetical protein